MDPTRSYACQRSPAWPLKRLLLHPPDQRSLLTIRWQAKRCQALLENSNRQLAEVLSRLLLFLLLQQIPENEQDSTQK